jgi:DNA-binding NtrC family response regulator
MLERYDAGDTQPFNIFAGRLDKLKEEKRRKPPKRRKRQPLPKKSPPRKKRPRAQAPRHRKPTSGWPSWSNNQHERHDHIDLSLAAAVQRHIRFVYNQTNRNQRRTAKLLGISRATLSRHLKMQC